MNPTEQKQILLEFFEQELAAELIEKELTALDEYLGRPITDANKKSFSILQADVDYDVNSRMATFVGDIQLPRISTPDEYASALYDIIIPTYENDAKFSPNIIGFMDFKFTMTTWYPGDNDAGSSAMIRFGLEFFTMEDDCE